MKENVKEVCYWVVFVLGINMETGKRHYSFLTLHAKNRFQVIQEVPKLLPENPEYVKQDGTLIPHQIVLMQQIKPEQHEMYLQCFVETVQEMNQNIRMTHCHVA